MAKVSFTKAISPVGPDVPVLGEPVAPETPADSIPTSPVNENTALIPHTSLLPALAPEALPWDEDRIDISDIYLPRINLVHNVGGLMELFTSGDIVLNAGTSIHTPAQPLKKIEGTKPLNLTLVGICKKQFVEKKKQNDGEQQERGNIFTTPAEVVAAGGTLDYKEWDQNRKARLQNPNLPELKLYQNYDTALVVIEKPAHVADDEHLLFPHCYNDRYFVLALWGMKGTAHTNAAKHFYTAKKLGPLAKGYATRSWDVTTKLETYGHGPTWIPVVKIGPANPVEFIAFIKNVIGCATN